MLCSCNQPDMGKELSCLLELTPGKTSAKNHNLIMQWSFQCSDGVRIISIYSWRKGKSTSIKFQSLNSLYIYLFCNVGMLMQLTLNAILHGRRFRHDSKLLHLTPSHLFSTPLWGIHWIAGSKPKSLARSWRFLKALASGSWFMIDLEAPSLPGCQSPPRLSRLFIRSRTKPSLGGEEFQYMYRYRYIFIHIVNYIDLCSFKSFQNLQYLISYLPFDTTCFTRFRCQDFNRRKLLREVAWIDPTPVCFLNM